MKRLMEKIVFCGLVTAWRLVTVPTRRFPSCAKATTDGVVRPPSTFSLTGGSPRSGTGTHAGGHADDAVEQHDRGKAGGEGAHQQGGQEQDRGGFTQARQSHAASV